MLKKSIFMQNNYKTLLPISVIIPNYNSGIYLEECLNSILDERYSFPQEIIIVDDVSTDSSLEKAKSLQKEYPEIIKLIKLKKNVGAAEARLYGIKESTQHLISCPDADDILSPGALEEAFNLLENNDMVIIDLYSIDDNGITKKMMNLDNILFPMRGYDACKLTFLGWKIHEKGIFKKENFIKAYQNVKLRNFYSADEMVTRNLIYSANSIAHCNKAKYYYRVHANQTTNKNNILHQLRSDLAFFNFLEKKNYLSEDKMLHQHMQSQIIGKTFFLIRHSKLKKEDIEQIFKYIKKINCLFILKNYSLKKFKSTLLSFFKCNLLKVYFSKYSLLSKWSIYGKK